MNKSKMRALLAVLGACIVGALAMAGSAFSEGPPPSWHVEGKEFTGEAYALPEPVHSKFTIDVPGLAVKINCQTRKAGEKGLPGSIFLAAQSTHAWEYFLLSTCSVESGGAPEPKCIVTNTPEFTFDGLGSGGSATELHNYGTTKLQTEAGKSCVLPTSTTITIPNVTNSYGSEHYALRVNTSGTGTFGAQAATFSSTSFWSLGKEPLWGWY